MIPRHASSANFPAAKGTYVCCTPKSNPFLSESPSELSNSVRVNGIAELHVKSKEKKK